MQFTKSLLHFDDSSDPWKDEVIPNTWIATGGPTLTTNDVKFGTSALNINNNNNCQLRSTNQIIENIGMSDFTIEFWYKSNNIRQDCNICCMTPYTNNPWNPNTNAGITMIEMYNSSNIYISQYENGQYVQNFIQTNPSVLSHYAFVYDSTLHKMRVFVNGILQKEFSLTFTPYNRYFYFANDGVSGSEGTSAGVFDEFRYSICQRWTSNFTVPSSPYKMSKAICLFPTVITGTYSSLNGLIYYYRTKFIQGAMTETSNVVNYVTETQKTEIKKRQPMGCLD